MKYIYIVYRSIGLHYEIEKVFSSKQKALNYVLKNAENIYSMYYTDKNNYYRDNYFYYKKYNTEITNKMKSIVIDKSAIINYRNEKYSQRFIKKIELS